MTRYERAPMPPGLDAVAHVDGAGEVVIYLAETLTDCAADVVVLMTNAARNAGWAVPDSRHLAAVNPRPSVVRRAARIGLVRAFALAIVSFFVASGITAAVTAPPAHHARLSAPGARQAAEPGVRFRGSGAPITETR
jgi:hypothetical protein